MNRPPQAFVNDMGKLGKDVPADHRWCDMQEWKPWAMGYNAAVREANARTMAGYDMQAVARRTVTVPEGTSERIYGPQQET